MSEPTKVLIVDDDAAFSQTLSRILVGAGYECSVATSGAEARERLDDGDIDATLCDVRLPGESGLELLADLAADFPDVAVVMTTGVDDPSTAELAFEIGAYGYLIKPFTPNEIRIALGGALRRRELEAARRTHLRGVERTVTRLGRVQSVLSRIEARGPRSSTAEPETTERLSRALSQHDEQIGPHIDRMSRLSAVLAEAVGVNEWSVDEFRIAAALHDVGKIAVPDSILSKAGELTPDEHRAVQHHARIGYQLLAGSTSPLLRMAASIAFGHHEWWDGSGYPRGLQGEEIRLEARIVAIANVYDSLTSQRLHRPALAAPAALEAMIQLRGRQFEPRLLDVFSGLQGEAERIRAAYPDRIDAPSIRVLVVARSETLRLSLVRGLEGEPNVTIVGTAGTAAEAEIVAVACEPNVVLIDLELPDDDAARGAESIGALLPEAQVLMLTGGDDQPAVMRAIAAGCAGFVDKAVEAGVLVAAIRSVQDGDAPPPVIGAHRPVAQLRPTRRGLGSDLRPRELEVLRFMAAGLSNKALAVQLYISLNTVRNHVQSILYKLDAHSKLEAVATAVREGLIELDHEAPLSL